VITLLKRKSKCLRPVKRTPEAPQMVVEQLPESVEMRPADASPDLRIDDTEAAMLEEQQLLAKQTTLKHEIDLQKQAIVRLHEQIAIATRQRQQQTSTGAKPGANEDENTIDGNWQQRCLEEMHRREQLIAAIVDERARCARLRTQLELAHLRKQRGDINGSCQTPMVAVAGGNDARGASFVARF